MQEQKIDVATEHFIALKRESRDAAPADWIEQIKDIKGVTVTGEGLETTDNKKRRLTVSATEKGIASVRELFGDICLIEEPVHHDLTVEVLPARA